MTTGTTTDPEKIFNDWYEQNNGRIFDMCMDHLHGDECAAEDLAQDAYTKIWENIDQFEGKSTFDTWATRIAINAINDYHDYCNADKRTGDIEEYDDEHTSIYNTVSPDTHEKYNLVLDYIDRLHGHDKSVMQMYNDGYSHREIAAFLQLTTDQVDWSIRRSKEAIQEMAAQDEDWGFEGVG